MPAAFLTFEPLWEDHGLALAAMGMSVVFVALALVILFITLLPRMMVLLDRLIPAAKKSANKKAPRAKPARDDLSDETLVVIAAAVAAVIDAPHRVVHARPLSADEHAWSFEGRMQHHASHGRNPDSGR